MRVLICLFALLLIFLQYKLWSSHSGIIATMHLKKAAALQKRNNTMLTKRNQYLIDEIYQLKHGKNTVEILARERLGMIGKDEVYYRIIDHENISQ